MMLAQGYRIARGGHTIDQITRVVAGEGEHGLDLDVLGKRPCVFQVQGTAGFIEGEVALIAASQGTDNIGHP